MNSDMHYYINFLIAKQAGFSNLFSYKISYSAQYVDDNTKIHKVYKNITNVNKKKKFYKNYITQTSDLSLDPKLLFKIYTCFHFVPDFLLHNLLNIEKNKIKKNQNHIFSTIKGGNLIKQLLRWSISEKNPYLIGIASHGFMDSWAHQNFTGSFHSNNAVIFNQNIQSKTYHTIGHLDVFNAPDKIGHCWYDYRMHDYIIYNNTRFAEAIESLLDEYSFAIKENNYYPIGKDKKIFNNEFLSLILSGFQIKNFKKRTEYYIHLCNQLYPNTIIPKYNKFAWFNASIKQLYNKNFFQDLFQKENEKNYIKNCFSNNSDWFNFQNSAKLYQRKVMKKIYLILNLYSNFIK